ncbi:MAG: hypothetical protein ACRD0X_02005 [Thermoanaerobaculia bacterium]
MRTRTVSRRPRNPPPGTRRSRRARFPAVAAWQGPTLREFVARVESEFGSAAGHAPADDALVGSRALPASSLTGLAPGERLSPEILRDLCRSWGLPPEDFGVDGD